MAKERTPLFSRSPILTALILFLLEMALVFLFVPKNTLITIQQKEAETISDRLGKSSQEYVQENSDFYFYTVFVESGVLPVSYDFLIGQWRRTLFGWHSTLQVVAS